VNTVNIDFYLLYYALLNIFELGRWMKYSKIYNLNFSYYKLFCFDVLFLLYLPIYLSTISHLKIKNQIK